MVISRRALGCLVLGFFSGIKLSLGGEIFIGEVLALLYLLARPKSIIRNKSYLLFFAAVLCWMVAQLLSDVYNSSNFSDALKGILAPLVFFSTVHWLAETLVRRETDFPFFLIGLLAVKSIQLAVLPSIYAVDNPWKWGGGAILIGAYLIWVSFFVRATSKFMVGFVLVAFFAVSTIYFEARSLGFLPLAGFFLFVFFKSRTGLFFARKFRGGYGALVSMLLGIAITAGVGSSLEALFNSSLLDSFASSEVLGKYKHQASSQAGLLLAGRSESLIAIEAFTDAPLLGHGSWAVDKSGYIRRYEDLRLDLGVLEREVEGGTSNNLIPTHSHILSALVWSGIVGGLFWVLALVWLFSAYIGMAPFLPVYIHVGFVTVVWNILFSPFGSDNRWELAVFFSVLYLSTKFGRRT